MIVRPYEIRDSGLFKYYRLVRKWACKTYKISEPELELLIALNCMRRFTRTKFKEGEYLMSWDKKRWARLRREGWIDVWREGDRGYNKAWIYKTSRKCDTMIYRVYDILAGNEDIPTTLKSAFYNNKTYTDKVTNDSIDIMLKDKDR